MAIVKTRKIAAKVYLEGANPVERAFKVSAANLVDVADQIGGIGLSSKDKKGNDVDFRIRVKTPKGPRVARIGDYIVRDGKRGEYTYRVITADQFADHYTEVK